MGQDKPKRWKDHASIAAAVRARLAAQGITVPAERPASAPIAATPTVEPPKPKPQTKPAAAPKKKDKSVPKPTEGTKAALITAGLDYKVIAQWVNNFPGRSLSKYAAHLTPEQLDSCAARAPREAIQFAADHLSQATLDACAASAVVLALQTVAGRLSPERLAACIEYRPFQALLYAWRFMTPAQREKAHADVKAAAALPHLPAGILKVIVAYGGEQQLCGPNPPARRTNDIFAMAPEKRAQYIRDNPGRVLRQHAFQLTPAERAACAEARPLHALCCAWRTLTPEQREQAHAAVKEAASSAGELPQKMTNMIVMLCGGMPRTGGKTG